MGGGHRPGRGVPRGGRHRGGRATSISTSTGCRIEGRRLFAFLGGTIGNLDPDQRREFLIELGKVMAIDDRLLLGTDLVKDRARLVAAYDDAAGVTAEFNRNVLHVLNRELGADFDPAASSTWPGGTRTTSGSRCGCAPPTTSRSTWPTSDLELVFRPGEEMLTEISTKFSPDAPRGRARRVRVLVVESGGVSEGGEFLLTLARPSS